MGLCRLRAARAGLAVERYRSLNGELPDGLERLVPEYLESVPTDLFDGKPLRYRKLDKGFLVYSVGPDGQDDGGTSEPAGEGGPPDVTFTVERQMPVSRPGAWARVAAWILGEPMGR